MYTERDPDPYDSESARRIQRDTGASDSDAARIAATEMDGAATTSSGDINSLQTYCNRLKYPESLPPSAGAKEGASATLKSAAEKLGISTQGKSLARLQTEVDKEVSKKWGIK